MKRGRIACIAVVIALAAAVTRAQWKPIAPGIDYQESRLDGPTMVYVARADRAKKNWLIDTCIGQGTLKSGRETVSQLAARADGSVNFRGERYDVKVAVNGDYFSFKTGQSASGQITSGWFAKRFLDYSGGSGFVWRSDRRAFLGGNVRNGKQRQRVVFADSADMRISNLNTARGPGELVLYTPHYADTTGTGRDGVEVLVRVSRPVGVTPKADPVRGKIVEVRKQAGSTPLPFDHVVLSGNGRASHTLLEHAKVGQELRIELGVKDYGSEVVPPGDWRQAYASLGGHFYCVTAGKVPADRWERKGKPGAVDRHPRTAVAMNDHYVYLVVVDGRSDKSIGMTITELGRFCLEHLSATEAIAQDGGGSSTMWVEGKVMNVPSDRGKERPVANGYILAIVHGPEKSTSFSAGQGFRTRGDTELRLGPGTNYAVAGRVSAGQAGLIVAHRLNGIRAKKANWWKCRLNDLAGWMPEKKLAALQAGGR